MSQQTEHMPGGQSWLKVGIAVESWNRGWKLELWLEVGIAVESWNRSWKLESWVKVGITVEH